MSLRRSVLPAAAHIAAVKRRTEPAPRLGRVKRDPSLRVPHLTDYTTAPLPAPPPSVDWTGKATPDWGMYLNDRIGDCTCAAVAHATQLVTSQTAAEVNPAEAAVLAAYEKISGYDPYSGSNDNGCQEPDVLEYWRTTGLDSHKIAAWAAVDRADVDAVKQVIDLFGFAYVGVNVPQSWLSGPPVWDVTGDQIVGGHAIIFPGYDADGLDLVSWGRVFRMTWKAWAAYGEEAYACIATEWIGSSGSTPGGVALADLQSDLNALRSAA